MSDKSGTMNAGRGNAGLVETMMTADGLQLTTSVGCQTRNTSERMAASHKPQAARKAVVQH